MKEFNKAAGYKANIQKSAAILYMCNEQAENEIKEVPAFAVDL